MVLALFLTFLLPVVSCTLYSVQDNARPSVSQGDPTHSRPLKWWEGGPAFTLASARLVRLNFRGLYIYPGKTQVRALTAISEWHCVPCNASARALCSAETGDVLPATGPLRLPEAPLKVAVDGWRDLECSDSEHKRLVSAGVYDISACDVFDSGLDLAYTEGLLCHRHNTTELWEYWALVILSIVLVRFLSRNIQVIWNPGQTDVKPQNVALAACAAAVIIVLVDGDAHFLTAGDRLYHWFIVAYVAFYLLLHAGSLKPSGSDVTATERPVYNVILATLQLVACRLYTAAETPYNLVLTGLIATRTWNKLLLPRFDTELDATLLADSFFLAQSVELAYDGTKEMLVAVFGVAFLGGSLLTRG